jgi:hypothetical protein
LQDEGPKENALPPVRPTPNANGMALPTPSTRVGSTGQASEAAKMTALLAAQNANAAREQSTKERVARRLQTVREEQQQALAAPDPKSKRQKL